MVRVAAAFVLREKAVCSAEQRTGTYGSMQSKQAAIKPITPRHVRWRVARGLGHLSRSGQLLAPLVNLLLHCTHSPTVTLFFPCLCNCLHFTHLLLLKICIYWPRVFVLLLLRFVLLPFGVQLQKNKALGDFIHSCLLSWYCKRSNKDA